MNIIISIKYVQLEKLETTAAKFNVAPGLVFHYSFVHECFHDNVKLQLFLGNLEDTYYHIYALGDLQETNETRAPNPKL